MSPAAPRLWLASTSPRRRELLRAAGIPFALCEPGPEYEGGRGDHDHGEVGDPRQLAIVRARRKATGAVVAVPVPTTPVLGVDTVVELDGDELGKAKDRDEAARMLGRLAGRRHRVHTAHCLVWMGGTLAEEVASAEVDCRIPTAAELEHYLASGDWRGKAGAYGLQDRSQGFLVLADGAEDTVVGLHVPAVLRLLASGPRRA